MTQEAFAQRLGLSRNTVIAYEKGRSRPDPNLLAVVLQEFNASPVWLMRGKGEKYMTPGGPTDTFTAALADLRESTMARELSEPDYGQPSDPFGGFVLIDRYPVEASAGGGAEVGDEAVTDRLAFRGDWIRRELRASPRDLALLTCRGDSMAPTLADGDLLLVDTARRALREPGIYVLRLAGALVAKRVARHADGAVTLIPDNEAYPRETLGPDRAEELAAIGRVVWVGRKL